MGKKKILIIDIGKEYGGAEIMIENLISAINDEVDISLVVNDNGIFKKNVLSKYNINVLCIRNSLKKLLSNIIKIKKYVKENNIDIINVHGIIAGLIGVSVKRTGKVKLIATIHSDLKYDFNGIKKLIYYWIEKIVVNNCDEVITVSNNLNNKIFKRHHIKAKTIYNGIKCDNLELKAKKQSEDKFIILFVGRLTKVKNVELLLKGLKYLKNNNIKFECNIVGDGEEKEKLIEIAQNYKIDNYVKFLGFRSDVNKFMKKSDVLIITSHMEGIPMVIIESFLNRLPVVASNVGGIPEMITNNYNGILFDKNNEVEFKNCLLSISRISKEKMTYICENAYLEYEKKWCIEVFKDSYLKIFKY